VPILDPLASELTAHKTRTGRDEGALVFGRTATEPFNPETVRRNALAAWGWKEAANPDPSGWPKVIHVKSRADALKAITLHEARHTPRCWSPPGSNAKALSVIMGHSTIAMTFDTYGHLMPGGLDEARACAASRQFAHTTSGVITRGSRPLNQPDSTEPSRMRGPPKSLCQTQIQPDHSRYRQGFTQFESLARSRRRSGRG
jgi:hypothetical protein